ncbi:hypothetical protein [Rhizobium leguminosarum]|uniref:hypothetical protein n=1 Tax=Rhizobium leguminosarum TaxID=384 RepID=UPI0013BA43A4|nr:hypothetical protein [Rhizobium leguminosarum]NEI60908.1 hypothetical protein [Rhizobium leguminosarum]
MAFDTDGNSIGGGRNGSGQENTMELSGGGFVTATYGGCWVQAPEEHEYVTWLAARLNGSFRFINVPLKTDWQGPFPTFGRWPQPIVSGIPHSDGSFFSDTAGYSQATVWASVLEDAPLGAGSLRIRLYEASRPLRWSDWFSIYHPDAKGWRAYRYWDVLDESATGSETIEGTPYSYRDYLLAVGPALRAAVIAGTRVEFARPRFAARLEAGTKVLADVEGFWLMRPTLNFEEAF